MIKANWITHAAEYEQGTAVIFYKKLDLAKKVKKASFTLTALGVYEARIDGERVGDFVLAPGWTQYEKRIQYQTYDVTSMIRKKSLVEVEVGPGWMSGSIARIEKGYQITPPIAIIGDIDITYEDGTEEKIETDETWKTKRSTILYTDIYHGETIDARFNDKKGVNAKFTKWSKKVLIPQEGEKITEHEIIKPTLIKAPNGEKILDFGQNMTGYVEFSVEAKEGEKLIFDCGEILDKDGNFYRENYRTAKTLTDYTCREGLNTYKPKFSFQAFRYIRLIKHPGRKVNPDNFTGICVYSDMKKTGYLNSSNKKLNRLFDNIFWGQKDNYLDVPTDCPQRNERMGWTGDTQVFCRTATFNYDVEKFFTKWLHDLEAASGEDGGVPKMVPFYFKGLPEANKKSLRSSGAAWGDAATICPWEVYLTYGNKKILSDQFESMHKYVDYMTSVTTEKYMFKGHHQYGDWLGIDAPEGSYKGSSREDLIAQGYYAYSTSLVIKAGKILGKDVEKYEKLYKNIVKKFREVWNDDYKTQTEHAIALYFKLAKDMKKTAKSLACLVKANGNKLTTGFVGTPYLLHALSQNGYADVAYSILLQEEYPSWLFSVNMGATTIWEHWDGKKADGTFWSTNMNSFNHYAYGAVADWVYMVAAGINRCEEAPGFEKILIKPTPDKRLGYLEASIETRKGKVRSKWTYEDEGFIRYEIETPVETEIIISDETKIVPAGEYMFIQYV